MKSHLQLADPDEASITFRDIKYYHTSKHFFVEVNGESYTILKSDIDKQRLDIKDIKAFLDYLVKMNKEYITITSPTDGVTKLEQW